LSTSLGNQWCHISIFDFKVIKRDLTPPIYPAGKFAQGFLPHAARGRAGEITGYGERMARNVISELLKKGYLKSSGPRAPFVLAFPIDAVERWFPRLYPAG